MLTKKEQLIIDILQDIVSLVDNDTESKDEIRRKINELEGIFHVNNACG